MTTVMIMMTVLIMMIALNFAEPKASDEVKISA